MSGVVVCVISGAAVGVTSGVVVGVVSGVAVCSGAASKADIFTDPILCSLSARPVAAANPTVL